MILVHQLYVKKSFTNVKEFSNHSTEILRKCYLTDNLSNYGLILGRDILHEVGVISNYENKTKLQNCNKRKKNLIQNIKQLI